tara:strand:+ start:1061 stop:1483 length:423 start_codon:yes stop_codon:yes gene_type:complete
MKDSRQRILDKLAKTRSVKKAKLGKRKLDLSKLDDLNASFSDALQNYKSGLESYKNSMNNAIGYLYELSEYNSEFRSINDSYMNLYEQMMELGFDVNVIFDNISSKQDYQMQENRVEEIEMQIDKTIGILEHELYLFETK